MKKKWKNKYTLGTLTTGPDLFHYTIKTVLRSFHLALTWPSQRMWMCACINCECTSRWSVVCSFGSIRFDVDFVIFPELLRIERKITQAQNRFLIQIFDYRFLCVRTSVTLRLWQCLWELIGFNGFLHWHWLRIAPIWRMSSVPLGFGAM